MNIIEQLAVVRKDLSNLNKVLETITALLKGAAKDVKIEGKTLRKANVEQPALFGYYDEIRVHLQAVSNYMELLVSRRKAEVLKYISEESQLDYGERIREKLVDEDLEYHGKCIQKLDVDEVLELAKSVCRRFEQRGYTLNNISRLVVAQAQDEHMIMTAND